MKALMGSFDTFDDVQNRTGRCAWFQKCSAHEPAEPITDYITVRRGYTTTSISVHVVDRFVAQYKHARPVMHWSLLAQRVGIDAAERELGLTDDSWVRVTVLE